MEKRLTKNIGIGLLSTLVVTGIAYAIQLNNQLSENHIVIENDAHQLKNAENAITKFSEDTQRSTHLDQPTLKKTEVDENKEAVNNTPPPTTEVDPQLTKMVNSYTSTDIQKKRIAGRLRPYLRELYKNLDLNENQQKELKTLLTKKLNKEVEADALLYAGMETTNVNFNNITGDNGMAVRSSTRTNITKDTLKEIDEQKKAAQTEFENELSSVMSQDQIDQYAQFEQDKIDRNNKKRSNEDVDYLRNNVSGLTATQEQKLNQIYNKYYTGMSPKAQVGAVPNSNEMHRIGNDRRRAIRNLNKEVDSVLTDEQQTQRKAASRPYYAHFPR